MRRKAGGIEGRALGMKDEGSKNGDEKGKHDEGK